MNLNNWIMIGLSIVIGSFLTFIRFKDYQKHQALKVKVIEEGDKLVSEVKMKPNKALYALLVALAVFMGVAYFVGDLYENIALTFILAVLIGSEWLNFKATSTLYLYERHFLYNTTSIRYKSIKTITLKNKRASTVTTLSGESVLIPVEAANAITDLRNVKKK
jgi:xanthine/uracil/vitamin C permease (AzgA family)